MESAIKMKKKKKCNFASASVEPHIKMGAVSTFRKNIKLQREVTAVCSQPLFLEGVRKGYTHRDVSLKRCS